MSTDDGELILHTWWPRAWGLPSLSPECVAVEAYLRLAGLRFTAEDCKTPYASSGQLPALDACADVVGGSDGKDDQSNRDHTGALAAHRITSHLRRKVADLDAHVVTAKDRASLAAYLALVEARVASATTYFTWIDRDRFTRHTRDAYGRAFPAPLSYILPWLWRRQALAQMPGHDEDRVASGVRDAYAALTARLVDGGGAYLMGDTPTSVDALAFAHLAFHAHSPACDALQRRLFPGAGGLHVEPACDHRLPGRGRIGGEGGSAMDAIDSSMWLDPPTAQSRGRRGWWGGGAGGAKKKQRSAKGDSVSKEVEIRRAHRHRRRAQLSAHGGRCSCSPSGTGTGTRMGTGTGRRTGTEDGDGGGGVGGRAWTMTTTRSSNPPRTTSSAPSFSSSPDRYAKGTYPVLVLLHRSIDDVVAVRPRVSSGLHKSCSPHLFSVTSKVSSSFSQILA